MYLNRVTSNESRAFRRKQSDRVCVEKSFQQTCFLFSGTPCQVFAISIFHLVSSQAGSSRRLFCLVLSSAASRSPQKPQRSCLAAMAQPRRSRVSGFTARLAATGSCWSLRSSRCSTEVGALYVCMARKYLMRIPLSYDNDGDLLCGGHYHCSGGRSKL